MIEAMFAKINEATLSLFCELRIRQKTNFAYYKIILIHCGSINIYGEKKEGKWNIFKNCTWQQVNKSKNTADKQHSPWSWLLLTTFAKSNKKIGFLLRRNSNLNVWSFCFKPFWFMLDITKRLKPCLKINC